MVEYDKDYFKYQKKIGEFGAKINKYKVQKYVKPSDIVLDFGCGGGYLLAELNAAKKIGIEVNPFAIKEANKKGISVYQDIKNVKNASVDIIISHHVLEHIKNPLETLKKLRTKLKKGGKAVFIVPHEVKMSYKANDINQHLYTWSPMNLGNIFTEAGFKVQKVEWIRSQWPPYFFYIHKLTGDKLFNIISQVYGRIRRNLYQVRIVAIK
jgi:SAM-dependent methyltransferase